MVNRSLYLQSFLIWLILAVLTILFGGFREVVFIPLTGLNPNIARALLLPIAFFYLIGITTLFLKKTKVSYSHKDMIKIGGFWLMLTIAFEFGFFGLAMGHSLEALLADYNLFEGRTWSLFLICILLSPIIAYKFFIER
jgi:hypothetical protein